MPNLSTEELGELRAAIEALGDLSTVLDAYMDWAQTWHKQAGGYTATDTLCTMMRMEGWARRLQELTGQPQKPLRNTGAVEDCGCASPPPSSLGDHAAPCPECSATGQHYRCCSHFEE